MLRCQEPGWVRIGTSDSTGRRSLWARLDDGHTVLELCAGREGDDAYLRVDEKDPVFYLLRDLVECQLWATEADDFEGVDDALEEILNADIGDEICVQRCHKELARAVRGGLKP